MRACRRAATKFLTFDYQISALLRLRALSISALRAAQEISPIFVARHDNFRASRIVHACLDSVSPRPERLHVRQIRSTCPNLQPDVGESNEIRRE
jgi:hypothetical protein